MRVLVTGSRDWETRSTIYFALHQNVVEPFWERGYDSEGYFVDWLVPKDFVLVHGKCTTGADVIADDWCIGWNFIAERHRARWEEFGRRAGILRNIEMVDSGIDLCFAFIKNKSPGSTQCAEYAESKGVPTMRFTE